MTPSTLPLSPFPCYYLLVILCSSRQLTHLEAYDCLRRASGIAHGASLSGLPRHLSPTIKHSHACLLAVNQQKHVEPSCEQTNTPPPTHVTVQHTTRHRTTMHRCLRRRHPLTTHHMQPKSRVTANTSAPNAPKNALSCRRL